MITARAVAAQLGISERQVYDLTRLPAGEALPCYRFGRAVRFDLEEVQRFKGDLYT